MSPPDAQPPMHATLHGMLHAAAVNGADASAIRPLFNSSILTGGGDDDHHTNAASPQKCIKSLLDPLSPPTPSLQDSLQDISIEKGPAVVLSAAAAFFSERELSAAPPISLPAASGVCDFFSTELRRMQLEESDFNKYLPILIELRSSLQRLGPPTYAYLLYQDVSAHIDCLCDDNRIPKAPSLSLPHSSASPSSAVNVTSMGYEWEAFPWDSEAEGLHADGTTDEPISAQSQARSLMPHSL